jgi:hypothetical protein
MGGYETAPGIIFDARCVNDLAQAAAAGPGFPVELGLEDLARRTTAGITESCAAHYPELSDWIDEWRDVSRKTVVICESKQTTAKNYSAYYAGNDPSRLHHEALSPEQEQFASQMATEGRRLIVLGYGAIPSMQSGPVEINGLKMTLVHEIFHGTGANSHGAEEHNKIEVLQPDTPDTSESDEYSPNGKPGKPARGCQENIGADRVNILESLCDGTPLIGTSIRASEHLYDRMEKCGNGTGCEKIFTKVAFDPSLRSSPLAAEKARTLCRKIYEDGKCFRMVLQPSVRARLVQNPELAMLRSKLADRFKELFPKGLDSAVLSKKLKAAFPKETAEALKAKVKRLRNSEAYVTLIAPAVEGHPEALKLFLAGVQPGESWKEIFDPFFGEEFGQYYFESLLRLHPESPVLDCRAAGLRGASLLDDASAAQSWTAATSPIGPYCPE